MRHLKKIVVMLLTLLMCLSSFTTVFADDEEATAEPLYTATYEFVLDDGGDLPDEVMKQLPEPQTNLRSGDVVVNYPMDDVETDDCTYHFLNWSEDRYMITDIDVTFIGTWTRITKEQEKPEEEPVFEPQGEEQYRVTFTFVEQSGGELPDEVMKLLPKETRADDLNDIRVPDFSDADTGKYQFKRWDSAINSETDEVFFIGVWGKVSGAKSIPYPGTDPDAVITSQYRTSDISGLETGFYMVQYLDGEVAFCVEPWEHSYALVRTSYWITGTLSSREAEIIYLGQQNGMSTEAIQAALWNYLEGGHRTVSSGEETDPNSSTYNGHGAYECWGNIYETQDYGGTTTIQSLAKDVGCRLIAGKVKVYKRAAATTFNYVANCPNNYSLAGAVYGIYSNAGCSDLKYTVTTGSSGESNESGALNPGTYYVKEITPSRGFKIDTGVYPVSVTGGNTSSVTSNEQPLNDPVDAKLFKYDRRDSIYVKHLNEAQFTLRYYDAQTNDVSGLTPKYEWVYSCFYNDQGKVICNFQPQYLVSGPDPAALGLVNSAGLFFLPLGTFAIEETLAPQLFAKDDNIYVGHITAPIGGTPVETVDHYIDKDGVVHELSAGNTSWVEIENLDLSQNEELQTVSLVIQKVDQETGKAELPTDHITSTATLAGGVFHVYRIGRYDDSDTPKMIDIDPIDYGTIITDENGVARLEYERINGVDTTDGLLPGKFRIVEEKAPDGFALKPTLADNTYTLNAPVTERNTPSFRYSMDIADKLTRIQIEKLDQDGDLVSGEVTATIQLIETETGRVVYEFVADGEAHIIKGLTTLMNYHLHELYVAPNYKLAIDKEVNVIDKNDSQLHGSADEDHPYTNYYHMVDHEVEIHTTATFSDEGKKEWDNQSNKHYVADGVAHIFDEVAYKNVYEGEQYKLVGELWDKTDDVSLNNVVEKEFTPAYDVGIETLEFDQQLDDLDNHELVVFETLYRIVTHDDGTTEEIKVVEHRDLDDEGQTVYVDELYRRDFEIIKVNADDEEEVLEGVTFNIKTYRIKRDGAVEDYDLGNYTTDENGKINIEKLKEDCKITVTEIAEKDPTWYRWEEAFIYDIGHDASITEALSETILNHRIKIGTTAIFEESDEKNYVADGVAHIIDTVSYEWLYEGDDYKLVTTLIDKGTEEEPLEEEAMTVEQGFVADGLSGSEDVSIEFDFTDKENHDFVVFEELYHIVENEEGEKEEVKVAEHKDIDDEDQTVHCDELYRALMVMYKTNEAKTIRLNGAIFTVTTKRTRRDGSIVTGNLGRFVTGGIYYEQATAFTYKIATDEEMSDVVRTIASSAHSKFGTQYIQITDLEPGVYYGQVSDEETIRKYVVARGMIYLEDQVEDTLITYHEEIAPEGYYLPGDDFVADVGHDDTVTRIENERPNTRIIHRGGDTPVVPKTGYDGE